MKLAIVSTIAVASAQYDYEIDYASLAAFADTIASEVAADVAGDAASGPSDNDEGGRYAAGTTLAAPTTNAPATTRAGGPMLAGFGCFHCDAVGATTEETYQMCATIGVWKDCPDGDNYYCMYEGRSVTSEDTAGVLTANTVSMCTGCKAKDACINNVFNNFRTNGWGTMTQCRPEVESPQRMGRRFRNQNQASVCRTCFDPCEEDSGLCFQAGAGDGGSIQNSMVAGVFGIPHHAADQPADGFQTADFYMDPTTETRRFWWGMGTTNTDKTFVEEWQNDNENNGNVLTTVQANIATNNAG